MLYNEAFKTFQSKLFKIKEEDYHIPDNLLDLHYKTQGESKTICSNTLDKITINFRQGRIKGNFDANNHVFLIITGQGEGRSKSGVLKKSIPEHLASLGYDVHYENGQVLVHISK